MKTFFAILLAIFALSNAVELPKGFVACRRSSPEFSKCLDDTATSFMRSLASGDKSLGIPPIEPLVIKKIKIGDNNGPVGLRQEYRNVNLHGLTQGLKIYNYRVDFDNLVLHSESINKKVTFVADYELAGKILLFSIHGKGRSNITMTNVHTTNTIYCEKYQKNGETYLNVTRFDVKFNPEDVILQFDNLHDSEKVLGDHLEMFMKENPKLIFNGLQGPYEEAFGLEFQRVVNHMFRRLSMKNLFPE